MYDKQNIRILWSSTAQNFIDTVSSSPHTLIFDLASYIKQTFFFLLVHFALSRLSTSAPISLLCQSNGSSGFIFRALVMHLVVEMLG